MPSRPTSKIALAFALTLSALVGASSVDARPERARAGIAAGLGAPASASASASGSADAADDLGELAHPVDPPPSLHFVVWHFEKTAFYGGPSTAVVAVPNELPPGARMPLVILLPGGHHNMQSHDHGTWGWWSEYGLGDIESALRRGVLTDRDFQGISRPPDLERMNRLLAVTPYRGAVIVTPWVVGRQLDPRENGAMVADFLRVLVKKAREELPVMTSREATGIGGMSSGGLWALYAGSECSDLFGSIVATQPFTEDLLEYLRTQIESRKQPQRIRMITSVEDHQRGPTLALSEALRRDGIDHELFEYEGAHSAAFAAGPGGLDAMLTFDRWLRGEQMDGTRPLPARDGTEALPFIAPPRVRPAVGFIQSADEPHRTRAWSAWRVTISSSSAHRRAWTVGACGALMVAGLAFWRLRRHGKTAEIE